jgi:REP-associated tyrosine transposase
MADSYAQIYIQVVFAVEERQRLIQSEHKEEIYKYITGIVRNQGQKMRR